MIEMKEETTFRLQTIFCSALVITGVCVVLMILYSGGSENENILTISARLLDIEYKLEPFPPYEVVKLESVGGRNDTSWLLVVKLIDVDTNSTVYKYYDYDLASKSLTCR